MDIDVHDVPEQARYEALADGESAGYAEYQLTGGRIVFTHTVIEPRYEGQGVGGRLVRAALDDAQRRGLPITARCSFVRAWLDRHPDYAEAVRDLER